MQTFYTKLVVLLLFVTTSVHGQQNLVISSPISATPGDQNTFVGLNAGNGKYLNAVI